MTLEEGFVAAHILQTNDVAVADLDYLIYKKERITVGQELTDTVHIHYRLGRRIVERCLHILTLDFLAYLL